MHIGSLNECGRMDLHYDPAQSMAFLGKMLSSYSSNVVCLFLTHITASKSLAYGVGSVTEAPSILQTEKGGSDVGFCTTLVDRKSMTCKITRIDGKTASIAIPLSGNWPLKNAQPFVFSV